MLSRSRLLLWPALTAALVSVAAEAQMPTQPAAPAAIAGIAPGARPADAPIIGQFSPDIDWRTHALRGVTEPVPKSLGFLDSQGAWYTPFIRPGMLGRYDLRSWHSTSGK